jgi:uncharacterized protein YhhL (DUF1145 family)
MQSEKQQSPLELYPKLLLTYEEMLCIHTNMPLELRIEHFRLQLMLCRNVYNLRKAMQNCYVPDLSRDERKILIKLFKDFENDQAPEILGWTVDRKFHWSCVGLGTLLIVLTLPSSILSKFDMNLLLALPKNIFSPVDILKLLGSFPVQPSTTLAFLFVILVAGIVYNFTFFKTDQRLRLYMGCYDKFPNLESFHNAMKEDRDLKNIKAELLTLAPSSLAKLESAAFENLPTSSPPIFPQSDIWLFVYLGIFSFMESIGFIIMTVSVLLANKFPGVEQVSVFLFSVFIMFACIVIHSILEIVKRKKFIEASTINTSNGILDQSSVS